MHRRGLVIFDLDGTLFPGANATIAAIRRAFCEFGLVHPTEQEIKSFVGKPAVDLNRWIGSHCSTGQAPDQVAAVDRYELEYVSDKSALYPGIPDALGEIRKSIDQLAICTNGPRRYVECVIDTHDLARVFDSVKYRISSNDTKALMVRQLLSELTGRPAVVVGDRYDDVSAAHQNSLLVIAVEYGYGSAEELESADAYAASPSELPNVINMIMT